MPQLAAKRRGKRFPYAQIGKKTPFWAFFLKFFTNFVDKLKKPRDNIIRKRETDCLDSRSQLFY